MTSAPVKDLNSLMNFVGGRNLSKTGGMTRESSFGDVMNKARNDGMGASNRNTASEKTEKASHADTVKSSSKAVKTEKTAKQLKEPKEITAQDEASLQEAGEQMVKEVAEEFGVSQEDVERAMEELGLSVYALLDPTNLTQLVLTLNGEADPAVLLTDETLFTSLQGLLDTASGLGGELMQEMEISPEELQAMMAELSEEEAPNMQEALNPIAEADQAAAKEAEEKPEITVEVKSGGQEVRLTTDEDGSVTGTKEVIPTETQESITEKHTDQKGQDTGEKKGKSEDMMHPGSQPMEALLQDKVQAAEETPAQSSTFFSPQTQDIMDQIMDHMKIQIRPGMDQLEMQLHPESLGTVHVQLTHKGGEITAQFQVQNETVKAAIESQLQTLQESFKDQGVKVQEIQVTVESHGFESNLWQGQGREENASSQNGRKTPRRINLNDLDGLFEDEASEEELLTAKMMEANGNTVDYIA